MMDISNQQVKDSQTGGVWSPNTPVKHVPPRPPVIYTANYTNRPENQLNQPNWWASGGSSFLTPTPQVQGNRETPCFTIGNYSLEEAASCPKNVSSGGSDRVEICGMFNLNAPSCGNVSFTSLLALANAADTESNVCSSGSYTSEHHWRAANAFSCQNPYQLTPATSNQAVRRECKQSEMQNLSERPGHEMNEQNIIAAAGIDADNQQTGKQLKNSVTDPSLLVICPESKEIENPEKEGSNAVDLNKTPQQKPRRKKHRPKVIREDKPKRTAKTATAKENPGKRKYARKKAVNTGPTTLSAEANGEYSNPEVLEPVTPNPAAVEKNPTVKRTYARKKPLNRATPPAEATGEFIDLKVLEHGNKSCKRALNFGMEGHGDNNTKCMPTTSKNQSKSTVYLSDGVEVMVENTETGIAFDLTCSLKKMLQAYISLPEKQFSPIIPNASNYSNDPTYAGETPGKELNGTAYPSEIQQQNASSTNLFGINYNALEAFRSLPVVQFPTMCKKRRTEKRQFSTSCSTSSLVTAKNTEILETPFAPTESIGRPSTSTFSCWISSDHNANGVPERCIEGRELCYKQQGFGFSQTARSRKKRSRDPTRLWNFASLTTTAGSTNCLATQESVVCTEQQNSRRPCTSTEAIFSVHTTTVDNRTRESISLMNYGLNEMQPRGNLTLCNQNQIPSTSLGASKRALAQMHSVDAIAEELKDIYMESSHTAYREQNALVLYQGNGTIVPFDGSSIKKRRPRPKVNLDEETNRVWNLLLANINSEGIDGTDEEKVKWWEEERKVFHGRVSSFIARMHLVQGDRRFSPWKGSVVDSVVGVFLTQNVSDHLSSSAFMSMVSHFPLKPHSNCMSCYQEGASSVIVEPIIHIPEPEDTANGDTSNQSTCDQSAITIHDIELQEEREVVNSNESSCRSSTSIVCSATGSYCGSMANISSSELMESGKVCYRDEGTLNDALSSQNSAISSQNSADSPVAQIADIKESCSVSNSEAETMIDGSRHEKLNDSTSFMELLQRVGSTRPYGAFSEESSFLPSAFIADSSSQVADENKLIHGVQEASKSPMETNQLSCNILEDNHVSSRSQSKPIEGNKANYESLAKTQNKQVLQHLCSSNLSRETIEVLQSISVKEKNLQNITQSDLHGDTQSKSLDAIKAALRKAKSRRVGKEIRDDVDWEAVRKQAEGNGQKRERTANTMDSVDWEAVRSADVHKIANTIKDRGMNNVLAERIKEFLNRLVQEHGSIDLEWLRDIPPDKAKEYLLSIRGLGLKSVECVRLLTLHHLAFPVDTNVGRIAVRLGWVPLQPLPESLQLHLLELYPVLESIQKYLWPRLCKLDQKTLYELHYQMITFGKVFCTKSKPNCNACPMRGECRHFASAFASARLSLPGPEESGITNANKNRPMDRNPDVMADQWLLPMAHAIVELEEKNQSGENQVSAAKSRVNDCVPIVEEPLSPEPDCTQFTEIDMEDNFCEDPNEIPTIKLNIEEFTQNLQNYMQQNMELQEVEMSKALVALSAEAASIPTPKLKNMSRLRTEHQVYELPDYHPLLKELDVREPDDPCSYLLAIWTPGNQGVYNGSLKVHQKWAIKQASRRFISEMPNSIQPPERSCATQDNGKLCDEKTCFSCNSIREAQSQTVRGTLLIPCRTAMRGSFPLNGTYFQVNEVFADHETSKNPINVPREWIWNLPRRTVYFGTSIPTIFKGLTTEGIQQCFWRGKQ
ncbi:hypothetical protein Tsubulata_036459 [Turnera subulata]|uniref:HhH-GPD domain-containing protein n=1 Tax=Turnera subulata TaxID=218843 RepID=A0A9Q0JB30_9ROSI|nr:hypothetical protein Tsubulata_036459 [Turnera subulata]